MKILIAAGLLLIAGIIRAETKPTEDERIEVGENARVTLRVPDKWTLTRSVDGGYPYVHLQSEDRAVVLQVSLFPDENGLMGDQELQLVMLSDLVARYVEGSVEQGAQLKPLNPRRGGGQFCVFTDAKLVDVKELPPNEYRHATTGLKTGNGWFGVFTLLSQDTDSAEYRAALALLRESLHAEGTPDAKPRRNPHAF